jgi:hypothetical protein
MNDGRTSTRISVSDGTTVKLWSFTDDDRLGNGTIVDAKSQMASFNDYLFRPHKSDAVFEWKTITAEREDSDRVALRYRKTDNFYVDAEYLKDGPFLKPLRYQYHPIENGNVLDGTKFTYQYAASDVADRHGSPPIRVEQISRRHGVHEILHIKEITFAPEFDPNLFELQFPEGTHVQEFER